MFQKCSKDVLSRTLEASFRDGFEFATPFQFSKELFILTSQGWVYVRWSKCWDYRSVLRSLLPKRSNSGLMSTTLWTSNPRSNFCLNRLRSAFNLLISSRSLDIRTDLISSGLYDTWVRRVYNSVEIITHLNSLDWLVWPPVHWFVWTDLSVLRLSSWIEKITNVKSMMSNISVAKSSTSLLLSCCFNIFTENHRSVSVV